MSSSNNPPMARKYVQNAFVLAFAMLFAGIPSFTKADFDRASSGQPVTVRVIRHACEAASESGFESLGFLARTRLCPAADAAGSYDVRHRAEGAEWNVVSASVTTGTTTCEEDARSCAPESYSELSGIPSGAVTLAESGTPGFRYVSFGSESRDDERSLVSYGSGIVSLDTSRDADGRITLHVFEFDGDAATSAPDAAAEPGRQGLIGGLTRLVDGISDRLDLLF